MPYSDPGTLAALATLPEAFDVDTADELARLGAVLAAAEPSLLPEQRALSRWVTSAVGTT